MSSYFKFIIIKVFFLGFASGLPIAMTASTLQAYLYDNGVTLANIGLFSLASIPYSLKFIWAPLFDEIKIPILHNLLGRRKSWIILFNVLLILSFYLTGSINAQENLFFLASIVCLTSFLSASQDIVIDAFRIEMLDEADQGIGVAASTLGYRIGMLCSGAGALYVSHYYGWHAAYLSVIFMMFIGLIAAISCKESLDRSSNSQSLSLDSIKNSFVKPFVEFSNRDSWWNILLFVGLFKMSDAFAGVMTNSFLMDIGFNKKEIADIVKIYGIIATLIGSIIAGSMLKTLPYYKALLIGGILQMVSNLVFVLQAYQGHDVMFLAINISIENLASGISSTVLLAYISNICNREFTATQYALLTSTAGIARSTFSSSAGKVAELCGWSNFFIISSILSLPSIYFLNLIFKKKDKNAN